MTWFEALILGVLQGLTEFLPISSSGHLELGKAVLDVQQKENMTFTLVVHGATVLSTLVVFFRPVRTLLLDFFRLEWNDSTKYIAKIFVSMLPVLVVGLLFEEQVEQFFGGDLVFVGTMLLITAFLLALSHFVPKRERPLKFRDALLIGVAQALAVLPGISRSGATISTGLILGNNKTQVAEFSFLMVLIPIIGANVKDLLSAGTQVEMQSSFGILIIGFVAAFLSGLLACKWMLHLVRKGKLIYFAVYCLIIGGLAIWLG